MGLCWSCIGRPTFSCALENTNPVTMWFVDRTMKTSAHRWWPTMSTAVFSSGVIQRVL